MDKGDKVMEMHRIEEIQKRLKQLEEEIRETKSRLPAHSVKPPVMIDLLALEDEYDELLATLNKLKSSMH